MNLYLCSAYFNLMASSVTETGGENPAAVRSLLSDVLYKDAH